MQRHQRPKEWDPHARTPCRHTHIHATESAVPFKRKSRGQKMPILPFDECAAHLLEVKLKGFGRKQKILKRL